MKFSAKGEYGIRAILDIAINSDENPVQVREIAKRQSIPERFLEHVMAALKRSGLVDSIRGAQGGYLLGRPASEISLAEIVEALEGPINLRECISDEETFSCDLESGCVVQDVWRNLKSAIQDVLESITLEDLVNKKKEREKKSLIYHI